MPDLHILMLFIGYIRVRISLIRLESEKKALKLRLIYEEEPESVCHNEALCDNNPDPELNCEGQIVGIRFKCAHCPNYDFCQACGEKWNTEPSETMLNKAKGKGHLQSHVWIIMTFPN